MAATGDADPEIHVDEVRRRFLWARRQGRPAWLWPEISVAAWRGAMKEIEGVVVAMLADESGVALDGEPEPIGLAGYTSGMGPLLGLWVEQGRVRASGPIETILARHLSHNRLRAARMQAAAAEVVGRLAERGIPALVLKGSHTAPAYFPEPGVRPASDIDLLVAAPDASAAEATMEGCGLRFAGRNATESSWFEPSVRREPRSITYVHAEDPWSIDLHSSLKISVGYGTPVADFDLVRPMSSVDRWLVDPRGLALEQPLLLLHLATHAGAGWQNLTLLRQVELVMVIRRDLAAGQLSWSAFLDAGARIGALGYAYPALRLAEMLAPGLIPGEVLDHCVMRAPSAVRRAVDRVTPATAQRIDRNSVGEHFMWAEGWGGRIRQLTSDLFPLDRPWPEFRRIYEERAWRLIRGTVSQ